MSLRFCQFWPYEIDNSGNVSSGKKFHCDLIDHICVSLWNIFLSSVGLTGVVISEKNKTFRNSGFSNNFLNFWKTSKNVFFCEYGVCLNADSKACGCAIDMVDGASETLDLTLSKRNMIEFWSNVIGR